MGLPLLNTYKLAVGILALGITACSDGTGPRRFDETVGGEYARSALIRRVVVTIDSSTFAPGSRSQAHAVAYDRRGHVVDTRTTWTTSNRDIAGVSDAGLVRGKINGTAWIRGKMGTVTDSIQVTIGPASDPGTKVALPPTAISVASGDKQSAKVGTALAAPLVVEVTDSLNTGVAGVTVSWAVASGGGSVSAVTSVTDSSGLASINWTLGSTVGAQTATATVSGLTGSPVTFSATGTAASATTIALNSGNNQTATVNTSLAAPLVVKVTDASAAAMGGVTVNWAVATGGGLVSAATSVTNASGLAQITWTLGSTVGAQTATATVAGLTGSPVTFSATGTAVSASAHVYLIAPTGSDANNGTTAPWLTFSKAWSVLAAGDTLQVADGSYASVSPPAGKSGAAGSNIVIRAVNPGGAKFTAELSLKGNAYLSFIGFKITGSSSAVYVESNGTGKPSHHLTFQQIGFTCTDVSLNDNECFGLNDGTHHVVLEDSWGWGGGRYTVSCYGGPGGSPPNVTCDNNTFRRLVLRMGPSTSSSGNPQASLALYYASNNIVENVIAIDGHAASNSSNSAFYITGHAPPPDADNNKYYGVIALNNLGTGFYLDCSGAVCNGTEVYNSVFWASADGGAAMTGGSGAGDSCSPGIFDHNTIGAAKGPGYELYACYNQTLTNNVFFSNQGFGVNKSNTGSITTNHHNGYFGNTSGARQNLAAGTGDLTSDPGFKYITQIEAGSPYKNTGSSGDIGANVINRYQNGTLTGTPLWPWAYEARIKTEMCAGVATGWCGTTKTLTQYIWGYLGNASPY